MAVRRRRRRAVVGERVGVFHIIGGAVLAVGAFVLMAHLAGGRFVTLTGLSIAVVPAYVTLFWLIFERQAGKDAVDDATRRSIAAYRRARTTEEQADALRQAVAALTEHLTGDNTPKGRHHR